MNPARTVLDEYEDLTALILDGAACDAERARFNEIAREFPEFRSIWLEQVRLHALLVCRGGGRSGVLADAHELVCAAEAVPPEYRLNDQSAPCPVCSPLDGGGDATGYEPMRTSSFASRSSEMPPEYRLNDQSAPWPTPAPLVGWAGTG